MHSCAICVVTKSVRREIGQDLSNVGHYNISEIVEGLLFRAS